MQTKDASNFSTLSPNFAQATIKFVENQQFGYLCSFLIENSKSLITDMQNDFIFNNFNRESDVVTLINTIYEYSEFYDIINNDTGLSSRVINTLYTQMESTFNLSNGREAVISAVKWSKSQRGGILEMTDKFVNILLEQKENRHTKRYTFVHAINANLDNKANIIFKDVDDLNTTIVINHRIGWHGLEIPGNIVILNDDFLIHHDHTNQVENPGIVGIEFNNPCLNSIFFLKLLESYFNDQNIDEDFIEIYRSSIPEKENAFLFHINNEKNVTILNFCPRTSAIEMTFDHIISMLLTLMPFVPYSILFNIESCGVAIEVNSYGPSIKYVQRILPYSDPDDKIPFVYPLCKETLNFAHHNIDEMMNPNSLIRFAITGESLLYNQDHLNETENSFSNPCIESNSVFDKNHPSHLVLLVDKKYCDQPQIEQLAWISSQNNDDEKVDDRNKKTNSLLYIPTTKEEELLILKELVKNKENDTTCLSYCSPPCEFLSRPLFVYLDYNKAKTLLICKSCQFVVFQSLTNLKRMIDQNTHKVDYTQLSKMYQQMNGISLSIPTGSNAPLGQIIWAMENDSELFDDYIKTYFTIFVEYAIHSSPNYFTFCPNHPEFVFKTPKTETLNCSCKLCQMKYCCKCRNWHRIDESCK